MKMFVRVLLTLWLAVLLTALARADVIKLHKGIATDIWVTWPDEKRLQNEPHLIDTFPEWRQSIGPKQIANLRKAGFDFVRLTIDPQAYIWAASPAKTSKLNANVLQAVQLFRDQDLKVLVDFHAIPTGGYRKYGTETYLASPKAFADFVAQSTSLAKALSGLDAAVVAYEPINEPVIDCEYEDGGNQHKWRAMEIGRAHV